MIFVVQGVIIPQKEQRQTQYLAAQDEPTTHDLNRILPYQHPYMGNASNLANLFSRLPLDVERTYELYPDTLTAEINYKAGVSSVGEEKVNKALIYNSVAAFALIGNLRELHYHFNDPSGHVTGYQVTRSGIEAIFGEDLTALLTAEKWKTEVQDKLKSKTFVDQCIEQAFTKR